MQRREFFSSLRSGFSDSTESEFILRPPYNSDTALFDRECQNCDAKCANACEEGIIKIAEDQTPYLDFTKGGCTFCDACANVCEADVLSLESEARIDAIIDISPSLCLAWNGVMCFSCKEPCLENAIVFQGLFKPVIDMSKCTACGFCIGRCPASAIEVEENK